MKLPISASVVVDKSQNPEVDSSVVIIQTEASKDELLGTKASQIKTIQESEKNRESELLFNVMPAARS